MLQPREADVPVLFVVFIVLPVIAYFLLGRWHEAVSKKARVGVLAQKAAEEAFEVETMACPDVILPGPSLRPMPYLRSVPSLRSEYHECATCHGPAKTRCSRCKSVRYCSGKCQITHWRQGHKETCQQWNVNGGSSSGGLPTTESSEQMPFLTNLNSPLPGGDIHPHDMNFDTVSEPSFGTTDSHNLDADLFPTERTNMNKSNQILRSTENGASVASFEKNNYSVDEETNCSEMLSSNKVSINSFGYSDEKNGNHDLIYPLNGSVQQPNSCGPETRKRPKASITVYEPDMGVYLTSDMISSCEGPCASATESLLRSNSCGKSTGKGNMIHKKPPYPPGKVASSQKPQEESTSYQYDGHDKSPYSKNEQRSVKASVSTSNNLQGCTGISKLGASKVEVLKKPSKFLKTSLVGLINDNKRSKVLFRYEDLVKFFQYEVRGISPRGLSNCGNSCYANAVLQCLMCTKPLMIHLLLRLHSKDCCSKNWCLMCELEQYASTLCESGGPVSPSRILSNLRNIGCRLGGGSQEDAHEFLRHLVMSMQAACLDGLGGEKQVEASLQETTLIQQMFGGRLKSKVKCLRCHHESERYENIMDLTLEIHGWVESLQDALTQFTSPEDLDGENMYKCGRCCAYVKARKQLSVHEVPNILTVVLKRFQTGRYGKINKCVTFPDMLDMVPFVTGTGDHPPLYFLYAVVVHVDTENASFSGHYISYVKDMQGTWLRIDDSEVKAVSLNQVMSEGAYMLFYLRSFPRPPRIYIEKGLLPVPSSSKRHSSKSSKGSKQEQKQTESLFASDDQIRGIYDFRPDEEGYRQDQHAELRSKSLYHMDDAFTDSVSTDFSDATSSEWSLFTSSDESSFTTESTRDSFSVVDYGDNAGLDPITSIFGPYYAPDHPAGSFASCTRFSPSNPQTRYFSESTGFVSDSSLPTHPYGNVYNRGRYPDRACASSAEPVASANQRSVYVDCCKDGNHIAVARKNSLRILSSDFKEVLPTSRGSPLPQQPIGKSHNNRTHMSADSRNFKLGTMFDTEQDLSKKFYSINDMTEELDTLLAYIEKDGGFRDASITLQQRPLSVLEGDLQNLLELLQVFKNKLEEQCSKADDLRNKMFQVSARQAYMKGILNQSSDTQYWDIWNRQKLSPEFEAKRQNILKANQNLTNQLVELERHFNNLEMNKFGETGRVASSRRAVYSNKSRSSQTQLSSVYNALNSQLAAAEQLSECLSKQISVLNISSPSKKRGAVTKELFESIGLPHTTDATKFSGGTPSKINQRFPSTKESLKGMLGPSKSAEPETARRRRESLDMSLASLEPQKTTVKRIAQQQRLKISSDLPFRSNKKMFDSQMAAISQETNSGSPSSSLVESYTSRLRSPTELLDEKTKPSGPQHNSLFKWVKEPSGPSQGLEQKHLELPGRMKSADQSSKLVPSSLASFSYTQNDTRDRMSSPNVPSFGTTQTAPKSNTLTFKTNITPKSNANTRQDMSPMTSSLPVKTLSGESGAGSTLTAKNRHGDQDLPSFGSMIGLGISSQNIGVNKPSLSSEPSKPVVLHGRTFQLSGVSDTMQNSTEASPQVAPQPHPFSPASQSPSFSIMSGASSLAASPLSTMPVSAAKTSDVSSSTVPSIPPPQKSTPKTSPTVPEGTVSSSIPSMPTPVKESSNVSKPEVVASEVTGTTVSASVASTGVSTTGSKTAFLPVTSSTLPSNPPSAPKIITGPTESSVITSTRKDLGPSNLSSDEDDMEEESPSASADLNLGALGGFGLGTAPSSSPKKSNPFGSTFGTSDSKSSGSPFTLTTSPGQLFRPASLSIPSSQPAQPSQSTSSNTFSGAFSSGLSGFGQPAQVGAGQPSGFAQSAQIGAGQQAGFGQPAQIQSGFGQPTQIGSAQQSGFAQPAQFGAQQALGSVLGSFGQSRQLGGGFGGFAGSSSSGTFASVPSSNSGFAGAAAGGGFSAAATSVGGGFAAAATGGGFASLASKSGGFGGAAQSGGFGGAAQGGGFGGAAQGGGFGGGGFGAFGSNSQGATGFSSFGASGTAGPGGPPADFLTQMRK